MAIQRNAGKKPPKVNGVAVNRNNYCCCSHLLARLYFDLRIADPRKIPGHRLHLHENNAQTTKPFFPVLYT